MRRPRLRGEQLRKRDAGVERVVLERAASRACTSARTSRAKRPRSSARPLRARREPPASSPGSSSAARLQLPPGDRLVHERAHDLDGIAAVEHCEPRGLEPARRCRIEHAPARRRLSVHSTITVAARRDDRLGEPQLREVAVANDAVPGAAFVPTCTVTAAGTSSSVSSLTSSR